MKILRLFSAVFLIFSLVFTITYGYKQINAERLNNNIESYQCVLSMWQIDSFEGGTGSRKQFLLKVARGFEKVNRGVLLMVTNMTKDGAEENFSNGIYPDIISYGNGVSIKNNSAFTVNNIVKGGQVGDKTYATAWCRGGYVLITNPNFKSKENSETLVVSQTDNTQPLIAMLMNSVSAKSVEILTPMDAYVKFVSGTVQRFLGTQRDIVRLATRGMQVEVEPLKEYNDLYQYVSICASDQLKRYYAEQFINYLVSEKVQKQVKEIAMLSCFYNLDFENEHLNDMQKITEFKTLSAFIPEENLKEMQHLSKLAIRGDEEAKIKIKNIMI